MALFSASGSNRLWRGTGWRDIGRVGGLVVLMASFVAAAPNPTWWPFFVGCGLAASALVVWIAHTSDLTMTQVLAVAVLFRVIAFPLLPTLSDDAFRYVWDGWLQIQGINPFLHAPADAALAAFHDEPIYAQLNSAAYYSVYPPFSQLLFAVGGLVYPLGWSVSYYVIKAGLVAIELGGVVALTRMAGPQAALLYAWNPLVVIETAGQAHTEAAMVGFLFITVWAVRTDRPRWASVALAGAGWVKLYPFVLFPLLIRRFGWRAVWPGAAVAVLLAAPYASPEVVQNVAESLRLYVQLFEFNAGPYYGTKALFELASGADWSKTLGPAFGILFGVSLLLLYLMDWMRSWSFASVALAILGLYLACSTTVHPWYLLGPIALSVLIRPIFWPAFWLGACSIGTYLFYVGGPYWSFVIVGWAGALAGTLLYARDPLLQVIQRRRGQQKADRLRPHLRREMEQQSRSVRVLDLGAGEGYVGQSLQRQFGAEVVLCDVIDFNRTALPMVTYDGHHLPFEDAAFDVTVLYFVLHHSEGPERVLSEALRVTGGRVVVVESVRETPLQHCMLRLADRWVNRVRSGGAMAGQEEHLQFRTAEEWCAMANRLDAQVIHQERFGSWPHPQFLIVLR